MTTAQRHVSSRRSHRPTGTPATAWWAASDDDIAAVQALPVAAEAPRQALPAGLLAQLPGTASAWLDGLLAAHLPQRG